MKKKADSFQTFAEAVRFWIEAQHFDLKSAAKELGVAPATLHNVLSGDLPKRDTLFRMAKRIGISNSHAFVLAEMSRKDTPDRIKELLWFFYEKTIDAPEVNVAEVIKELYPAMNLSPRELAQEERQVKNIVRMLVRLKWTTEYWNVAQNVIANLLGMQDQHILGLSAAGQEEYLGPERDWGEIFRQMARDDKRGVKLFYLDRRESPRGYVMSAVSIPRGYGAFEFGTATTYGFEMGMVVAGEGLFFSKGLRKDEAYLCRPCKEKNAISFSRHRSHCILVTSEKMEILNIQMPFTAGHLAKLPIMFRVAAGKRIVCTPALMYTEGRNGGSFRARPFLPEAARLPSDLERLILSSRASEQQSAMRS
ncbi:helix-turn-helix transcriptional regulator [candidate division KSB1 bacterium]|nr:helix-turn-helix transcriptional regulator [candidate division KSB1 bacterium]